jgi:hypothetical protein
MMELLNLSPAAGVGIAAGIAAVTAFWSQTKAFASYLSGFLLLQKTINGGMTVPVGVHVRRDYRKLPSGISTYRGLMGQIDDNTTFSYIPFEMPNQTSVWWGPRGLFLVQAGMELKLVSLRWLSDPQGLIQDALASWEEIRAKNSTIGAGNFYVKKCMGSAGDIGAAWEQRNRRDDSKGESKSHVSGGGDCYDFWCQPNLDCDRSFMYESKRYVSNKKQRDPFQGLFFDQPALDLVEAIKRWFTRESWYRGHGIPWRTGALLYGPGGTGKSSIARAVAETLGVPLYQYYLSTFNDREFVEQWDQMSTPCVVALEDFDNVFHGREPATVHKALSFDCVLNQISGIGSVNGVCLIVTTNRLELVDPAMGNIDEHGRPTRPGRIDHVLELGPASCEVRVRIADYTLDEFQEHEKAALVAEHAGTTPAQFQHLCIEAALRRDAGHSESAQAAAAVYQLRVGLVPASGERHAVEVTNA